MAIGTNSVLMALKIRYLLTVALFPALTGSDVRTWWLKSPHCWLILSAILIPHDRLDDALLYAVLEGDFGICQFDGAKSAGI